MDRRIQSGIEDLVDLSESVGVDQRSAWVISVDVPLVHLRATRGRVPNRFADVPNTRSAARAAASRASSAPLGAMNCRDVGRLALSLSAGKAMAHRLRILTGLVAWEIGRLRRV
jgi:hypothetical protein